VISDSGGGGIGARGPAERRGRARRVGAAGGAVVQYVAVGDGAGEGGGAAQVGGGRARNRGRDVRLGRIADRSLQRLVGDRFRGVDQLLQRGDAGVGGLQHLHTVADPVEQVTDVAGAVVEPLSREEVGGIVERRIDLLAGGQALLSRGQ